MIEASGVPLCTAASQGQIPKMNLQNQMLEQWPRRFGRALIHRNCSFYEQRYSRPAVACGPALLTP